MKQIHGRTNSEWISTQELTMSSWPLCKVRENGFATCFRLIQYRLQLLPACGNIMDATQLNRIVGWGFRLMRLVCGGRGIGIGCCAAELGCRFLGHVTTSFCAHAQASPTCLSRGGFLVAPVDGRPVSFFSLKRRKLVRFQGNTHYLNLIG